MKPPRIALWIIRTRHPTWPRGPRWLRHLIWPWAVRRVHRWHDESGPARQRYYDQLFSGPRLKGVVYDAKTHSIEIGDGPIFDKLWEEFRESERLKS